jgi:hypothetical protein
MHQEHMKVNTEGKYTESGKEWEIELLTYQQLQTYLHTVGSESPDSYEISLVI